MKLGRFVIGRRNAQSPTMPCRAGKVPHVWTSHTSVSGLLEARTICSWCGMVAPQRSLRGD